MDGNQRWAKKNNLKTIDGYNSGLKKIKEISDHCISLNIKTLTVFALSSENFKRNSVNILFKLIKESYFNFLKEIKEGGKIKINIIGEKNNLSSELNEIIKKIEKNTNTNQDLVLNIVFNYGLQNELIHIVKKIIKNKKEVTIENIKLQMYLGSQTDPDLLIRTGGYQRLSNFIPLNLSYTDFFFTKILWPDFSIENFNKIIKEYNGVSKNYGL